MQIVAHSKELFELSRLTPKSSWLDDSERSYDLQVNVIGVFRD